jgi:hypothetical protein
MKKMILMAIMLIAFINLSAQNNQVTLKLILHPIQSIQVNKKLVVLEYKTVEDYNTGMNENVEDHLLISCTSGYVVMMHSSVAEDALNKIILKPTMGSTNSPINAFTNLNLTQIPTRFFIGSKGFNQKFNINYVGLDDYNYLNDVDKEINRFATTVTYTIVPE